MTRRSAEFRRAWRHDLRSAYLLVPSPDRVSLLTLDGRVVVPFRFGTYAEGHAATHPRAGDLLYRKRSNTFFLAITVDAPEPTPDEAVTTWA